MCKPARLNTRNKQMCKPAYLNKRNKRICKLAYSLRRPERGGFCREKHRCRKPSLPSCSWGKEVLNSSDSSGELLWSSSICSSRTRAGSCHPSAWMKMYMLQYHITAIMLFAVVIFIIYSRNNMNIDGFFDRSQFWFTVFHCLQQCKTLELFIFYLMFLTLLEFCICIVFVIVVAFPGICWKSVDSPSPDKTDKINYSR